MIKLKSFDNWLNDKQPAMVKTIQAENRQLSGRRLLLELAGPPVKDKTAAMRVAQQNAGSDGSFMPVDMAKIDVSVATNYEQGFHAMLNVVSNMLASDHRVRGMEPDEDGVEGEAPWSSLYQLNVRKSTPQRGVIELSYMPVAGAGTLRNLAWSAGYMLRNPLKTIGQKIGLATSPEHSYLNQFQADLRAYAAKGRVSGLDEWEVTTSGPGRNILIMPKR
jgi:hypothetical protein